MKINTQKGVVYVYLPKRLFEDVKILSKGKKNINFEFSILLLHFIIRGLDKNEPMKKYTHLSSKILRRYNFEGYKYNEHLKFLEDYNFITSINHISNIKGLPNKAKGYKLANNYLSKSDSGDLNVFVGFELTEKKLTKKYHKTIIQRKNIADYSTNHLTKWLKQDNFGIDYYSAITYINFEYSDSPEKRFYRLNYIKRFRDSIENYSRQGKDDRLHSYFTGLPSDLKRFITYKGRKLVEVDIKSSQPVLLAYLLDVIKQIFQETKRKETIKYRLTNKLKNLVNIYTQGVENSDSYILNISNIANSITIMLQEGYASIDFAEIDTFNSMIRKGDIYTHISEILYDEDIITKVGEKYVVKLYDKEKEHQRNHSFDSLRECGKTIVLNTIYAPNKVRVKALKRFQKLFPQVFLILSAIKLDNKADLAILMQRIESRMILDKITKNIAKKHFKMPIITRHDSISTTVDYKEELEEIFKSEIDKYLNNDITLNSTIW